MCVGLGLAIATGVLSGSTLCLSLALAAGGTPVWTLEDVVAVFERSSPELIEARLREQSARAEVTRAGARPNPSGSFSVANLPIRANTTPAGNGGGIGNNAVLSLAVEQPFELGGKRGKRLGAAREALASAHADRGDALRRARHDVERAFWQAILGRERRALAEEVRARYGETLRISRARFASDDISAADLEKIELEGAKQENDLAEARSAEAIALEELLRLVGPEAPPAVELHGDLAPGTTEPLPPARPIVDLALSSRPDLAAARSRVEAARAAHAVARAAAVPDLTVGVGYAHSQAVRAGDNPDAVAVTVSLPIPLFSRNQGEIEKASVEVASAEETVRALEATIAREVASARARLAAALEKVARYQGGTLEKATRALEVAERTYREGETSLLSFLEAQRTYIALRGDYLDTLFELRAARLEIQRAVGIMSEEKA